MSPFDIRPNHSGETDAESLIMKEAKALHIDQNPYFLSGKTQSLDARRTQLLKLKAALKQNESLLLDALQKDLRKHPHEAFMSELGIIYDEIKHTLKHLKTWVKPRKVRTPPSLAPAKSYIVPQALGRVLIIAPWNYPLQLAITPLVGAIAGGNVVTIKPSELTPHTSAAIAKVIGEAFSPEYIQVIEGGVDVSTALLKERWDLIFFTGSTAVGQVVAEAAAKHLTPTILELGGKSPCLVTRQADLALAARRIIFGKILNSGQSCIAPDYLLVEKGVEKELIKELIEEITIQLGEKPLENPDMPKVVNSKHFARLTAMITPDYLVHGGKTDPSQHLIEPTILLNIPKDHPSMREEIFGPILPIMTYDRLEDAMQFIQEGDYPLSLYIFSNDADEQRLVTRTLRYGGGSINDTMSHIANTNLPFGGVGKSGWGAYHGEASFHCFVHKKAIFNAPTWIDLPIRYAPWTKLKNRIIRFFLS